MPEEYQEYTEQIETLRGYGLGLEKKTTYAQIIEWLEAHNGRLPRGQIRKNGIQLKTAEMTEAEREEINLYQKWLRSPERRALKACKRNFTRQFTRRVCTIQRTNSYFKEI